jgi:hypothetical protein
VEKVVAPLFKMRKNKGWQRWVWVGAKGLGRGGSGEGYGQVDGLPFPFNWGKESRKNLWVSGYLYYDPYYPCLMVNVNSYWEVDHGLFDSVCENTEWFLCEV